jgi:hypothetical protein
MDDFVDKLDELVDDYIDESEERAITITEVIAILEAKIAALKGAAFTSDT